MAAKASPTSAATPIAAGVRTPGTGAYSDPAQVGAMIQKMYPQYAGFDATTLGQRWIAVHTPAASTAGAGTGTTDLLQAPDSSMDTQQPGDQKVLSSSAPDLSGLGKFARPVKQQPKPLSLTAGLAALQPNVTSLTGNSNPGYMLGGGNTLYSAPQIQPQQQPKPQQPQGLSTFDISKANF